ncbi:protein LURP-one-related 4-like [Telopea speciosissima]|uniref:protein LURP-one-related 4-like n=1 Tax=Telopea speciosissima TaxID=54955 RepID=UPI001CC7190A|nr:protein LURP-one-related 4-like [Telopea speciosissima]
MAKVFPQRSLSSSSSSSSLSAAASPSSYVTTKRETFTIWMKSLVMHSNGCTVYNSSSGEIVYRIDNYNEKCRDEVDLMDFRGNVLLTIRQKKLRLLGCWEGYRNNASKPWFQVKKLYKILKRKSSYKVTVHCDQAQPSLYLIEELITGKSEYKILNESGEPIAEVKQKQSSSGVSFGNDVLTLMVEPHIDHSLIMGIVTVYGIICHKL